LFRLNTESSGKKNAATWRELFVTAVGCYLMLPQGPPGKIDVEEIRRRDESLAGMASGEGVFAMLIDAFSNLDPAHGTRSAGNSARKIAATSMMPMPRSSVKR